ncbi:MCE family protein [Actinomadura fibrosa]|uniref:MCE family protein n=1 Tax=Actinomadura fibrosa TaxID=111802 RepID=A0ABW2XVH4_9ACTN|nr:MCE family protein [Actinomadura fibrosa]
MTRRVRVNLAVFALLAAVLGVWAVRNVLRFEAFSHPYRISARFATSPGLQPGFDVTYLGVAVGKIHSVRLDGRSVLVRMSIDRGRRIPRDVRAAAALKSAIGEPYVDLEPAAGAGGGPPMRPGEVIPLSRTSVSETYGDLFASVTKAINGLDPGDLRTVTRELARGLDGRGDTLRMTVDGGSRLASAFAAETGTIDQLITNLGALTRVLAAHRGDLGTGIAGTAQVTSSLAEVDDSLRQLRDTAPGLLERTAALLRDSRPATRCLLSALGAALPAALTDRNVRDLEEGLRWSPQLASAMKGVLTYHNGDPNLNITFIITPTPVKTVVEYKSLAPLPAIPPIPACPGVSLPKQQIPPMSGGKGSAEDARAASSGEPAGNGTVPARTTANDTHRDPMAWLICIPPVIAGLILLRVLIGTLRTAGRPLWRRRR